MRDGKFKKNHLITVIISSVMPNIISQWFVNISNESNTINFGPLKIIFLQHFGKGKAFKMKIYYHILDTLPFYHWILSMNGIETQFP